ncbi:hypothetical protein BDV38DRAFT_294722 [Aspergillus pseudotamarii]|uniref:DUF4139 domain-containing protein n=1 Tax=Aspergillus pseudotamarii TaxID=132259 RepID=A0A5N6SPW7_ASPPS|nr:uncharacterized protein BDV38DRAFT_294722 [Aspergillus pseudotamarii]KAE8135403.1 hypothetical protein BDV38DRAFT_294722 [Aspergillus pseudotamarii]
MAEISTSTIQITDLPTKSVTITPQRATIVREIHTTIQKTGQHTLTITGLDPRVDTDSILIEGTGTATITDIQTSIVPRRDKFEDVYPVESDSEEDSVEPETADSNSDNFLDNDDPELKAISKSIAEVEARLAQAQHEQAMAVSVREILDDYAKKMDPGSVNAKTLEGFLGLYTRQRVEGLQRYHQAGVEVGEGEKELARLVKRQGQVEGRLKRAREVASKKERREKEKKAIERARKTEQRKMEREERLKFWTVRVGQVVVDLDSQAGFTPGSSRRGSVVERVSGGEMSSSSAAAVEPVDVKLCLSYVVPGVSWSSRYELRINTPSSSARMAYRAEFRNSSSETWTDARVTLSTSQASFSGLEQRIPSLHPWHIKLLDAVQENQEHPSWEKILLGGYANRPAFFRARVKNTSSLRIIRGRVGLTVDGTFLGTATIPNCAPGDFFNVSLGVDPSILVTYGKPTVRRLNTGFFTGHAGAVFRRTCWIKNTKGVAVDITVLDQVPVSEDKELQVEMLEPKGLHEKGNEVKLDMEASHGSGKAIMEKKGEVKWVIHLEPGKDVRVALEYGTKAPRGSEVDTA